MFDVKKVEADAAREIAEEKATAAKTKIKESLRKIAQAEKILQNLRQEHAVLLADIGV